MSVKEIRYILKRVLQMIPVLLLVMVLIFALIRFIPGDPADVMLGARATEESRAMLHAKMGIDKPIYEQFFLFMKNCLRLDFGESILSGEPVSQILARRFQVTASLTGMTALFTMLLALPIGYFSGVNKHNAAGNSPTQQKPRQPQSPKEPRSAGPKRAPPRDNARNTNSSAEQRATPPSKHLQAA